MPLKNRFFFFHGPATCNRSVLWGAIILAVLLLLLLLLLIAGSILKVLGYAVRVCCWSKCLTTPLRRLCVFGLIALQCCFFSFSSSSPFAFSTDKSNRKWCSKCHVTGKRTTATEKIASRVAAYFTVLEHQKQLSIITCLFSVAIVLLLFVCLLPPTKRRGHFLQFSAKLANPRGAGFHTQKKVFISKPESCITADCSHSSSLFRSTHAVFRGNAFVAQLPPFHLVQPS